MPGESWPAPMRGSMRKSTRVHRPYLFSQHVLAFAEGPNPAQVLAARSALIASGQPQGEVFMSVFGYLVDL